MAGGRWLGLPSACLECCFRKKKVGSFKGHLDEIFSLAFSPNSQTLASGSKDGRVYLWDLRSMKEKQEMETVDYRVAQEQASSIQQLQDLIDLFPQAIWAECDRGNLDVFSPPQLERQGLRVSPDGKHRVAPGEDGHLEVFNLQTGLYEASLAISRANRGWRSGRYQGHFISNQRFLYHNGEKWLIWNVMDDRLEPRPIPEVFTTFKGASDDGRYLALFRRMQRVLRCGSMTLMLERKSPCSRGWTIIPGEWCFPPDGSW